MDEKQNKKMALLNTISSTVIVILFLVIIFTPIIIRDGYSIFTEEEVEMSLILFLVLSTYVSRYFQKKYTQKLLSDINKVESQKLENEEQLNESFKYIGQINVQLQEIKNYLLNDKKYPTTKNEFKKITAYYSEKILAIIPSDFVLLRFVQTEPIKTMSEFCMERGGKDLANITISNKVLAGQADNTEDLAWISSTHENTTIKVYAVFNKCKVSEQQKILIKTLLNDLEMIFIIYKSNYFKQNRLG